jgi:heptosyltransferase-3/putative inorganic carbon (HCO3(-)) transporter
LALLAEAFSYTRAGWLGLITEGLALGIFTGRRVVLAWVLGVFLLIGGAFVAVSQLGYQRSTVDPWTFNARVAIWKLEMNEILTHPFVGIGYGGNTFMMRFADYPETRQANGPHSTFLMVAMGSGLPAFAFLVWLFVRIIKVLVSQASRIPNKERAAVSLAVAVMIVGFVTRNVFDYMFAGSLAYLFWILVALGLSQEESDMPVARRAGESPARVLSNR